MPKMGLCWRIVFTHQKWGLKSFSALSSEAVSVVTGKNTSDAYLQFCQIVLRTRWLTGRTVNRCAP
jgi:hypothetical protein